MTQNPFENYNEKNQQSLPNYNGDLGADGSVNSQNYVPSDSYPSSAAPSETDSKSYNPDPYSSSASEWSPTNENTTYTPSPSYSTEAPSAPAYEASSNYQQPSPSLNIKSLLGLIFSFVFFPAGLILSWMGLKESKTSNDETGRILAIIGLVISIIQTLSFVIAIGFFLLAIILGASSTY